MKWKSTPPKSSGRKLKDLIRQTTRKLKHIKAHGDVDDAWDYVEIPQQKERVCFNGNCQTVEKYEESEEEYDGEYSNLFKETNESKEKYAFIALLCTTLIDIDIWGV